MSEIKRRAARARHRLLFPGFYDVDSHWGWCDRLGLWETAAWIDKNKRGMLDWVSPGFTKRRK